MNRVKTKINAKPFWVYYVPVVILALIGFFDSVYLSISHYRVYTDISYKSFCAISKALNCDTVSQSSFSIFLGVPVPVLGVFGYLLLIIILLFSYRDVDGRKRGWHLLFFLSLVFSTYSIVLALISNYYIHSYCIMCILSYVVNLFLLLMTWLIIRRFAKKSFITGIKSDILFFIINKLPKTVIGGFLTIWLLISLLFPNYWTMNATQLDRSLPSGLTDDGHPWIGAENPTLTIVEYADYRCFQCGKMHYFLRDLVQSHPDAIRLIHRHFPMDHEYNPIVKTPFHIGSGKMSLLAIYAASKEKFWEMNDLLYNIDADFNLRTIEKETGIPVAELSWALKSKQVRLLLKKDIAEGIKLGITGTPSYLINEQLYSGTIPPEILNSVLP